MPTPKGVASMFEDMQKAQTAQDNERLCEILDMFLESSEVTMDFVIKSGGKTVKALRGSQDPDVRKKAIALTAQWKVLVTGQLEKKAAKKEEKDAGSEDEAGGPPSVGVLLLKDPCTGSTRAATPRCCAQGRWQRAETARARPQLQCLQVFPAERQTCHLLDEP